ncbi:magnesium transporter CorA family protein [Rhodobacter sp. Har01]|uniref:magnesium transporter CorA family protein n=1 Tax=Rhodobacter sp. Har01 TaxID=2883999 RepID=UPI001D05D50E|nr:magnesium transporter CorA family protein [Rhodobacter sp. Har01]MCB6178406.1 magnesium transporter CorA family protein [Rhodobacter sp. Har01]
MITAYRASGGRLEQADATADALRDMVWIDLEAPTRDEETAIEAALGLDIPTREDMQEIEVSSRLYDDRGALFLTAQVVAMPDAREPEIGPVTFVLTPERLVTVRYHTPRSMVVFADRVTSQPMGCTDGRSTLLALLETLVDRLADILEGESRKLELLSRSIFEAHRPKGKAQTLAVIVQRIGRAEDLNGKISESLATIQRILGFLSIPSGAAAMAMLKGLDKARLKTLVRDVKSLQETAGTQERKILFQLDATLGVINIRQSDIIKVFSVVAFVFLPPTLIASIYGMNFDVMPEIHWPWGYPMALGLMFLSALIPWLIFRWKKLL